VTASGRFARIPYPVMVVTIAFLTLIAIVLGSRYLPGAWALTPIAIPAAIAGVYLWEYHQLPYVPSLPLTAVATPLTARPDPEIGPSAGSPDEEPTDPDYDPVEEADRLEPSAGR
jgi:xanthine/uracil permease